MKKIIITADDYGMDKSVNKAIERGISCGLITSTNVMMGMDYCEEASHLKSKFPDLSVGIHWTLSAGFPVSKPTDISTLVDADGKFLKYNDFRKKFRNRQISYNDIREELIAQYNKFISICNEPDYWNTHQNIHVDFKIYSLFVDIARELSINKMRSHQRIYVPSNIKQNSMKLKWKLVEPIKKVLLDLWQNNAHKKGIKSPDGIIIALSKDDKRDLKYIFNNIQWKDNQIAEYVIHPATDSSCEYFGTIGRKRVEEYEQFTSSDVNHILKSSSVELVNFNSIS